MPPLHFIFLGRVTSLHLFNFLYRTISITHELTFHHSICLVVTILLLDVAFIVLKSYMFEILEKKKCIPISNTFSTAKIFFCIFYFIIIEWIYFDIYLTFWCRVNIWCRLRKKRSFSWLLASWCFSCSCCFSFSQIAASLPKWNHSFLSI